MELRQLRHFLALVEERSITRAAERELIVQSGLSNSIQALERELGTLLYIRGTRPVRLTAAGEALVGPARRTLTSAEQAEQAVRHTRDVLIGTLRIGISLSAQHLVPFASYLGQFTRDHPGIDLSLQYAGALTMISMVKAGELDCLIGPAVNQVPGVRMTRLAREPLHLVCRSDHRLAEQAEVNVTQLANERFVEVTPGWTARLLSDAAFAGKGIPRDILTRALQRDEPIRASAVCDFSASFLVVAGAGAVDARVRGRRVAGSSRQGSQRVGAKSQRRTSAQTAGGPPWAGNDRAVSARITQAGHTSPSLGGSSSGRPAVGSHLRGAP